MDEHDFTIPYSQIDPDNLDDEAERVWQDLRRRHLDIQVAENRFKLWWEERRRRYRDYAAARVPWRPSRNHGSFDHPGTVR